MNKFFYNSIIFVIFIILGSNCNAFGQNNSSFLLDSAVSSIKYSWQPGGATTLNRSKNFYDENKLVYQTRYWSGDNTINPIFYNYYYDNGKLVAFEQTQLNNVFFRADISYNPKGLTLDSITQTRYNCQPLKNGNKYSYQYNDLNLKSKFTSYRWTGNDWLPIHRTSYSYDNMKNITEEIHEIGDTNGLVLAYKYNYIYGETNKLLKSQEYQYVDQNWTIDKWTKFIYDGAHLAERMQYLVIDSTATLNKVDSLFYNTELLTLEKQYSVNNGTYSIFNSTKNIYDENNLLVKVEFMEMNLEGSGTTTTQYFYVPANNTIVEDNVDNFSINPNPANNQVTISLKPSEGFQPSEGSEISIYNSLGEKVLFLVTGSNLSRQINISNLPSGIYYCKISTGIEQIIKSFVIMK